MITSWADEEDKANAKYDAIRGKCWRKINLAPSTQQAEWSWLNTRARSEACQLIFMKLTKDEKIVR
jgi:hypothetical protein